MKRKLLGGAALLMAAFSLNEANATSCAVPPTCAQLGYTMKKADCGDYPVMRCPFAVSDDNQVYCQKSIKIAALPILYGDGTVSRELVKGKTPIGVVFDEVNKLAVALTDVKKGGSAGSEAMTFASVTCDIPNLYNCTMDKGYFSPVVSCGIDGRTNTNAILACGGCGDKPVATACNNYQPTGCTTDFCKKNKWFLPSMRDLNSIFVLKEFVNFTLISLGDMGAKTLLDTGYWSSTAYNKNNMWIYGIGDGDKIDAWKFDGTSYVRPVVKY